MDGLRLERADLQQKLNAATSEARAAQQELATERQGGAAAKTALAVALADVAKLTQQRDNAWKVPASHVLSQSSSYHGLLPGVQHQ